MKKEQTLYDIEDFNKIIGKKGCVIYGAGKAAKIVVKYASEKKYQIHKILVSDMCGNPPEIMGIPVYAIESCQDDFKESIMIAAVMENLHNEIDEAVEKYEFEKKYFISRELLGKLSYHLGDYGVECFDKLERLEKEIDVQAQRLLRFIPRPCLEYLVLNIADHCNLRCRGCDHFACVADPYFVSYETIHRDLRRLSEIFHGDYIMQIAVMGGEPLLHPDLLKILEDTRRYFPHTVIRLTTNGLLLLKQTEEFWRVCRENSVTVVNTKYPIHLDFKKMREKAETENVVFQFFEGTGGRKIKKSFKKIINLKGNSNPVESFARCHISNYGNFLMEGKFYGCPFSCQSYRIFNQKFHQNLRMTEEDFLDIYKVEDMQAFFDFAARPKYYCRYCSGLSPLFDWERSKGEISEWTEEDVPL